MKKTIYGFDCEPAADVVARAMLREGATCVSIWTDDDRTWQCSYTEKAEPQPMALAVGKVYKNRCGFTIRIVRQHDHQHLHYCFIDQCGDTYTREGRYNSIVESPRDLIEEVV